MNLSSSNSFALWFTVIIASTFHLPTTTKCLNIPEASQVEQPTLAKRGVITPPRFIVIPIFGPVTFNTMFNWGCSSDWSRGGGDYETRVKMEAAQAISDVVEQYAKAHPEMAKTVSLDLREIWLEENGQLPKKDEARAMKARADLQQFFDEHPELQEQAEDRFQHKVDEMVLPVKPTEDPADAPEKVPKDWAHIDPRDN